jgi:hypothetical protein
MAVSTAWGTALYTSAAQTQSLPSGLFIEAPTYINININKSGGAAFIVQGGTSATATSIGQFYVIRAVSGNLSQVHINFHCIGFWK